MSSVDNQKLANSISSQKKRKNRNRKKKAPKQQVRKEIKQEVKKEMSKAVVVHKAPPRGPKVSGLLVNPHVNKEGAQKKFGKFLGDSMLQKMLVCEDMAKLYSSCQTMPAVYKSKIPDAYDRKTARYDSKKVFEIPVNGTTNPDGTFAFIVQPILGNFGDPTQYQVAICKQASLGSTSPSAIDWTNAANYETISTLDGFDVRVDSNHDVLTQAPSGLYIAQSGAVGLTPTKPFGTSQPTPDAKNANLNVIYDGTSTSGTFVLPPGNYLITLLLSGTGFDTTSGDVINPNGSAATTTASNEALVGTSPNGTAVMQTFTVVSTRANNQFSFTMDATTVTSARIMIATANIANAPASVDDGLVESIRPCAMSVLASYKGPLLTNGGQIAMALIPSAARSTNFFTNSPDDPGAFRTWQTIASLNEAVYDGPIKDGAYGWWSQEDNEDYNLYQPSDMNTRNYPTLVCAGQWSPGSPIPAGDNLIIRVEVELVFELTSVKTLLPKDKYVGSVACVDASKQMLQNQPKCMPNAEHISWFKRLIGYIEKGAKFVGQVAPLVTALL